MATSCGHTKVTHPRNLRPGAALLALAALLAFAQVAAAEETPPLVLVDGTVLDSGTLPPAAELFVRGSAALQGTGAGQRRHGHVFRAVVAAGAPGAAERVCSLGAVDRSQTTSRSCGTCHETSGHPVDLPYAARAAGDRLRLRPTAQLPAPIVLGPTGEVTCTSCHDGLSARPHKTAFESSRMLCLACHEGPSTAQEAALLKSSGPRLEAPSTVITIEAPGESLLKNALTEK
jgi:hypothetical protein